MKKALSLFLALLFCTALFLTPASAQTLTAGEEDDPADSWRYENGEAEPSTDDIIRLAEFF